MGILQALNRHEKKNRNTGSIVLLGFILCGYLFFFTSRLWIPDSEEMVDATPLYEAQAFSSRQVYLTAWDYSERDHAMEVIVEVESTDLIEQELTYEAVERVAGEVPIDAVIDQSDHKVFRITDLPENWEEISLRLIEGDGEEILRLYTNADTVEHVDSLPEKDQAGYEADRLQGQIDYDTYRISVRQEEMEDLQKENREMEQRITELEQAQYPTEDEASEAADTVERARSAIQANEDRIGELQTEIADLEMRSEQIRDQISGLQ